MKVIEDTYRRYGKDIYLGLTGESLGAATEITALRYHPDVRFIVNDCGYADLIPVEKDGLKGMHLPQWLVYLADLSCRIIYHFSFTGRETRTSSSGVSTAYGWTRQRPDITSFI